MRGNVCLPNRCTCVDGEDLEGPGCEMDGGIACSACRCGFKLNADRICERGDPSTTTTTTSSCPFKLEKEVMTTGRGWTTMRAQVGAVMTTGRGWTGLYGHSGQSGKFFKKQRERRTKRIFEPRRKGSPRRHERARLEVDPDARLEVDDHKRSYNDGFY